VRRRRGLAEWQVLRPFCRQWFLVVTAWLHGTGDSLKAKQLVDRALEAFENDAELRLTRGSLSESSANAMIVDHSAAADLYTKLELRQWRISLEAGARDFERALEAAPHLSEAALRLARVRQLLGDATQARRLLEAVLERSTPAPFLRYHARLFLGELDEQAGDSASAATHYTEALVVMPVAQAPALALSRLNDTSGNIADAKRWLTRSLVAVSSNRDDPWWRYAKGQAWLVPERFQALQEIPFP
jgi:tetratricopeptide (TPR) repeat protein